MALSTRGFSKVSVGVLEDLARSYRSLALHQVADFYRCTNRSEVSSLGSLVPLTDSFLPLVPIFRQAVAQEAGDNADDWCFHEGFIFAKPGPSGPTFWHQDYPFFSDGAWSSAVPHHLMVLWYPQNTSAQNGALRVIPGSNLEWTSLHALWPQRDEERLALRANLRAASQSDHPLYQPLEDQEILEVTAGQVLILDSRMMHGACANGSEQPRVCITLWFLKKGVLEPGSYRRVARESRNSSPWAEFFLPSCDLQEAEEISSCNIRPWPGPTV